MPGLLIDLPRRGLPFLQRSGSLSRQRPAPVELEQFGGKVEQRGPQKGDDPYPLHHANLRIRQMSSTASISSWCSAISGRAPALLGAPTGGSEGAASRSCGLAASPNRTRSRQRTELGDAELTEQGVMALSDHRTPEAARLYVKRTETQRASAARMGGRDKITRRDNRKRSCKTAGAKQMM